MNEIIQLKNIIKTYGSQFKLLIDSFSIYENTFTALIGNNGSGKTTLINILCNLIKIDSGEVFFYEEKVTSNYVAYKKKLGIVLNSPYYVDEFSPKEYLEFVCKFQHIPKNEINKRIHDVISLFELKDYKNEPIKKLSVGNQMKISLCSAFIHNPEILILDEPFVNLDIKTTTNLIEILKSFEGKKTLIITSHNLDLVTELCSRYIIIEDGKIKLDLEKKNYDSVEKTKSEVKKNLIMKKKMNKQITWLN